MLRFILKREVFEANLKLLTTEHRTVDIEVPELENALMDGAFGEAGFDRTSLVAVEIKILALTQAPQGA